jgi:hypothetical protein
MRTGVTEKTPAQAGEKALHNNPAANQMIAGGVLGKSTAVGLKDGLQGVMPRA